MRVIYVASSLALLPGGTPGVRGGGRAILDRHWFGEAYRYIGRTDQQDSAYGKRRWHKQRPNTTQKSWSNHRREDCNGCENVPILPATAVMKKERVCVWVWGRGDVGNTSQRVCVKHVIHCGTALQLRISCFAGQGVTQGQQQ